MGFQRVDVELATSLLKKSKGEDRARLKTLLSGAVWDAHSLHAVGKLPTELCDLCGEVDGTWAHVAWACTRTQHIRDRCADIVGLNPCDLPACLRNYGIAPTLCVSFRHTFWGAVPETLVSPSVNILGVDEPTHEVEALIEEAARALCRDPRDMLEAFDAVRGRLELPDLTCCLAALPFAGGDPPENPNCYSDGSLASATSQLLSMGGAGVWWPGRALEHHPATLVERDFAHHEQCDNGVAVWAATPGRGLSSTRTELVGVILALAGAVPVHIATDSQCAHAAFIRWKHGIIDLIKQPRALRPNGDLMEP